jgi:tape measure domain-containing protein
MMADLNIALILKLVDRATAPARKATEALRRIGGDAFARSSDRAHRGALRMAEGLGGLAGAATRTAFSFQTLAAGVGIAALGRSMIEQASSFENYKVQLETLEGSSAGAERALTWIEDFAVKTPLQVNEVVDSYAKLRAFGIDPTNGTMMALVDTMAATGGGAEKLEGLTLALGQAWTKGKLQGEEAMQLLERGVPVYDLLAKATGKTTEEIVAMQSAGELGREEITLLIEAMGAANEGAAEKMSQTWDGIVSNIWDQWTRFQRRIMDSGLFQYLKDGLQELLDVLNQMAADGRLQAWAESTSAAIISGLQAIWDFGASVVDVWQEIAPWVQWAADAVGGFGNAAAILVGLKFAPHLLAIADGVRLIGVAALANPILLVISALIAGAYLIYDNWDSIVGLFRDFLAVAERVFTYITGWTFEDVGNALKAVFDIDLYAAGVKMMLSLWEGIKSIMGGITSYISSSLAGATGLNVASGPADSSSQFRDYPYSPNFVPGPNVPGRAIGGPVRAGQSYQWQEEGREMFVPRTDGTILSTRQLRGAGGGGGKSFNIGTITINASPGQSAMDLARAVRAEVEALAREAGFALHDGGLTNA